jgi:predicted Rossmann-fold nucleotide-binding protein
VLLDVEYWTPLREFGRTRTLPEGMISPDDLELLTLTDEPSVAVENVLEAYRRGGGASPHTAAKADAE